MSVYQIRQGVLWMEETSLEAIADACGTPAYVYSRAQIEAQYRNLDQALAETPHKICYAVKANANLAVLDLMSQLGSGFDVVSGGELERVLHAGGDPGKVVFSGVGKTVSEINFALKLGIACFNVESQAELLRLEAQAKLLGIPAPVSLRVNPDIDPGTHPYISTGLKENKFGITTQLALSLYHYAEASPHLSIRGIACHIGSQITSTRPLIDALSHLLEMTDSLATAGIELKHVDVGGGFGIPYQETQKPFDFTAYGSAIGSLMQGRDLELVLEPGRYLVADAGVLLSRVEYLKPGDSAAGTPGFAIVDCAMNDLMRPALYEAWHGIDIAAPGTAEAVQGHWNLAGPICESTDVLARNRELALAPNTLIAIRSAGAYGFVQSSNYNARNRAIEILVHGEHFTVVRKRETLSDQIALESRLPS